MSNLIKNEADAVRLIKKTKIFGACSDEDMQFIATGCHWRSYPKGKVLFLKGDVADGLYIVNKGEVEITTYSDDGRQIILNVMGPSDFFGEVALIDLEKRTAAAVAVADVEVLFLPAAEWNLVMRRATNECLIAITISLCRLFRRSNQRLEDVHFYEKRRRLIKLLASLCDEVLKENPATADISLRISQDRLAKMVGLTREFTNKILSTCERSGLLSTKHGTIVVHDYEYIKLYSEGGVNEDKLFNMAE